MTPELLRMFQRQAQTQCEFILYAADDLARSRDGNRVFFAIENLLNAAANLSKTFWGSKGKKAAERKPLRDSVGIADASPIRDVDMRNHFEHFDERLDQWWAESTDHNVLDMNIGIDMPFPEIDKFRNYMPQTSEVWFWGDKYNLAAIVAEAKALLPKLKAEASKAPWET